MYSTVQRTIAALLVLVACAGVTSAGRDDFEQRMGRLPALGAQLNGLSGPEQQFLQNLIFYTTSIVTSAVTPPTVLIKQLETIQCLLDDIFFNPLTSDQDAEVILDMLEILAGIQLDTALELPVDTTPPTVTPAPETCTVEIKILENDTRFEKQNRRGVVITSLNDLVLLTAMASEEGTFEWTLGPRASLAERFQVFTFDNGMRVGITPSDSFRRQMRSFPNFRTGVNVTVKFTSSAHPMRMCQDRTAINLEYRNPRR